MAFLATYKTIKKAKNEIGLKFFTFLRENCARKYDFYSFLRRNLESTNIFSAPCSDFVNPME
jgi:RNase P/RNase MRP subunit p30